MAAVLRKLEVELRRLEPLTAACKTRTTCPALSVAWAGTWPLRPEAKYWRADWQRRSLGGLRQTVHGCPLAFAIGGGDCHALTQSSGGPVSLAR
jgi:hypothetical protein